MLSARENYLESLRETCNEIKLDFFPQVEASELLYRVITLEDIYLPLSLQAQTYDNNSLEELDDLPIDLDELTQKINERLAAFTAAEESSSESHADSSEMILENTPDSISQYEIRNLGKPLRKGMRILIAADPGGGKTTFCKRLVLALINHDTSFFNKYYSENRINFDNNSIPIFIDCKNITEIEIEDLKTQDFLDILYYLSRSRMGNHFPSIEKHEFYNLVRYNTSNRIILILDGWDEILDPDKASLFQSMLNQYIDNNPFSDIVITIRKSYIGPKLSGHYTRMYSIKPLSPEDVKIFCEKWQRVILNRKEIFDGNEIPLADQILQSKEVQIQLMMKNPLELSLLLVVSKNDNKLPENKAILFERLVDLYIYWSTIKSRENLSIKTIRVILEYIAIYFTKHRTFICPYEILVSIIRQCINDVEWAFEDDLSELQIPQIINSLSHSGILINSYAGRGYSFFEGSSDRMHTHRQMQEYLAACAILSQYADEEYNSMNPVDILDNHFDSIAWKEVIVFAILIASKNNGRVSQELIKRLIDKAIAAGENNYSYTNFLFELVVKGASIRIQDRHNIYDVVFSDHITDQQIGNIILLVSYPNNKYATDFISYIEYRFMDSVNCGKQQFSKAEAIIQASLALKSGVSPFIRAEEYMKSDNEKDIILGAVTLILLSWCKYSKIHNEFELFFSQYHMPISLTTTIRNLLHKGTLQTTIIESIREAIIAGFASYSDFFSDEDVIDYIFRLRFAEQSEDAELALSVMPIFDKSFHPIDAPENIKDKYITKLNKHMNNHEFDKIIFTFCICVTIGCWTSSEIEEKWKIMERFYRGISAAYSIGGALFAQLRTSYYENRVDTDKKQRRKMYADDDDCHQAAMKPSISADGQKIRVFDEGGNLTECDILFTFDNQETGKSYIVYTDNTCDDMGKIRVYASIYHPESDNPVLEEITTDREWQVIDTILETMQEQLSGNQ